MRKRKIYLGNIHHVYQKTYDGGLLFYGLLDYLVYFTIFSSVAEKMELEVIALCPMVDHIHHVLRVEHRDILASFEQMHTHLFALEWNRYRDTKGQVFRHCYGVAAKLGDKNIRTVLAYNYNNPVERKLVTRKMRLVLQEVQACRKQGRYLHYQQLERWFTGLNVEETQQLTDFIINQWNIVDYAAAASYYPSIDAMIRAFHDNTGSEYDIVEERDNWSDAVYQDCNRVLLAEGVIGHIREIPCLDDARKQHCYRILQQRTTARPKQICKYLHLPLQRK